MNEMILRNIYQVLVDISAELKRMNDNNEKFNEYRAMLSLTMVKGDSNDEPTGME